MFWAIDAAFSARWNVDQYHGRRAAEVKMDYEVHSQGR